MRQREDEGEAEGEDEWVFVGEGGSRQKEARGARGCLPRDANP